MAHEHDDHHHRDHHAHHGADHDLWTRKEKVVAPASAGISRRRLLRVGLGSLPMISLGGSVPFFVPRLANGEEAVGTQVPKDNILVIVQLSGGNDGLNTVIPHRDDLYYKARKNLGIKKDLHKLDDDFALNPGMTAFKELWDEGELAIIHGCGYPKPNRSHFESMAIWHAGDPSDDRNGGKGWLGHYLDHLARGTQAEALSAINIGNELPMALVNDQNLTPSVQNVNDFGVQFDRDSRFDQDLERDIIEMLQEQVEGDPAMEYLGRQATNAIINADEIRRRAGKYEPDANYPGGLGERLKLIARLISADLGTKVFYCQTGGFDTHAGQDRNHAGLLEGVAKAIKAFRDDLAAKKIGHKVTVMCFSEFGRRVAENDGVGTDHGAAGPMFLVGPKVKGGFHGTHPSLSDLDSGDLKYTTDFRRVYATLLDQWLNSDSAKILGSKFEPMSLLS